MKVAVLLNPSAKAQKIEIQKMFAAHGISVVVSELDSANITEKAAELAKKFDVVVAGGGDGTVSAVAAGVVGTKAALGVLPLGTLNHFAKDLGVPLDISGAVAVISRGRDRLVDTATVNGWTFLNNSSVGIYPMLVRRREAHESQLGKWPAMVASAIWTWIRYRPIKLRYQLDGRDVTARVALAFIGNNDYGLEQPGVSNRSSLDAGCLSLYLLQGSNRLSLAWSAIRSLGRPQRHLKHYLVTSVVIDTPAPTAMVAIDGEVNSLPTPLQYQIAPKSLRVVV